MIRGTLQQQLRFEIAAKYIDPKTRRALQEAVNPTRREVIRCEGCTNESAPSVSACSSCLTTLLRKKKLWLNNRGAAIRRS